jgi:hypothetical protein
MMTASQPQSEQGPVLAAINRLVVAADGDTLYRDVYLRRAAELLAPLVSEAQYEAALTVREQLHTVLAQGRAAVARQDWNTVREVGIRAEELRRSLSAGQAALAAADAVYAAPAVVLDPLSPGITISSPHWQNPEQARQQLGTILVELARDDAAMGDFYSARERAIGEFSVAGPIAQPAGDARAGDVQQQALQALERGDLATLRSLADAMAGPATGAELSSTNRAPAARARLIVAGELGDPLPERCLAPANALGLEPVETPALSSELRREITEFLEQYALLASPAAFERAKQGVTQLALAAEKVAVPTGAAAIFAETFAQFTLRVAVNSAGIRYVPIPVEREVLLVEPHAEGDETVTPLLRELRLERRRGIARDDIEAHLRADGARVLSDLLGLDPRAFRLVCVPPDLYMRLGRDRGWGGREEWTHFDGYHLSAGNHLRALVGGNAHYGGLFDLCSIGRDDARPNTVLRLAVVRRARLGVRFQFGGSAATAP